MRNIYAFAKVAMFCIAWLIGSEALAQSRYWVGGAGSWSDSQHWSLESGGVGGASIPTGTDVAIVDKNSFQTPGTIQVSGNASLKGFIWTADARKSGLAGSGAITINGNILFESENSTGWKGALLLTSQQKGYVKVTSTIGADVRFQNGSQYAVVRPLTTRGVLEVYSDNVNFQGNKVRASRIVAPDAVKSTMVTGLFKSSATGVNKHFEIEYNVVNETCPKRFDGSIKVSKVMGGDNDSYTYMWLEIDGTPIPNETKMELLNRAKGFYIFVVRGTVKGNVETDCFSITVDGPVPLIFHEVTPTNATCNGTTGSVLVDAVFGVTPYTFFLNNKDFGTFSRIPNVPAGSYDLKIVDGGGCIYTYPNKVDVAQPADIVLQNTKKDVSGCNGLTNGSILAKALGGTVESPLECSKDGVNFFDLPDAGYAFDNLGAGKYTIMIRRKVDHSCQKTEDITIAEPAVLTAKVVPVPVSGCSVNPDGKIIISDATGGSGKYRFSIDGGTADWKTNAGANSYTFTGLSKNTYNVWIGDADNIGCQLKLGDFEVTEKPQLTATVTSSEITCNGANDGSITVTNPQGGSGVYDYSVDGKAWIPGSNGGTGGCVFPNLGEKTYSVQIRDHNNPLDCIRKIGPDIVLTNPAKLNATVTFKDVVGCATSTTGEIVLANPVGGYGTYQFSVDGKNWLDAKAGASTTAGGLGKGSYPVSIRDAKYNTCTIPLGTKTINAPTPITSTFTKKDITGCSGNTNGSITFINTQGGSGNYLFSIDGGTNYTAPANAKFDGVAAGPHDLFVKNAAGEACPEHIGLANIIDVAPMSATVSVVSSCLNTPSGSINVSAPTGGSGAYKYKLDAGPWVDGPTYKFDNIAVGDHIVSIQDANSTACIKILGTYPVGQLATLTAKASVTKQLSGCAPASNGSITITDPQGAPSGKYEYSRDAKTWSANPVFDNLPAGDYKVYIRELGSACYSLVAGTYTINPITPLTITKTTRVDPSCFNGANGSITVEATGTAPLLYSKGGVFQPSNKFDNLSALDYVITVKDNVGCEQNTLVKLSSPAEIIPTVDKVDIGCNNLTGKVTVTNVTGGAGAYQYWCTATNAYQPSNIFPNLLAGNYKVKVKDGNGCESSLKDVTIESKPILDVVVGGTENIKGCKGTATGSIILNVKSGTAPYQYKLNTGGLTNLPANGQIANLTAGSYDISVTDALGCTVTINGVTVTEPAVAFSANLDRVENVTACPANGKIIISAQGGAMPYSFSKENGLNYVEAGAAETSYTFTNLNGITYNVKVKDKNGCVVDLGAVPINPSNLALTATPSNVLCKGDDGKIDVSASNGNAPYLFALDSDDYRNVASFNTKAGAHTVKVKDNGGCIVTKPVLVSEPADAVRLVAQGYDLKCNGSNDGKITAQASGGSSSYTITLMPGNVVKTNVSSAEFTGLSAGSYTVTVTDSKCPTPASKPVSLKEPASVNIVLGKPVVVQPSCTSASKVSVVPTVTTSDGSTPVVNYDLMQNTTVVASNTTGVFDNVASGAYTIKATVGACSNAVSDPFTIDNPLASGLSLDVSAVGKIKCFGDLGKIDAKVKGGTLPYAPTVDVTMAGPSTTVAFNRATGEIAAAGLSAGVYTLTLSEGGCKQTQSVTIDKGPDAALVLGTPTIVRPATATSTEGSIAISATGGTPNYEFSMTPASPINPNPSATGMFGGLGANTYNIKVTDKNGCLAQTDVKLDAIPTTVTATVSLNKNVTCNGAANGQIDVTIASGLAPYTINVASDGTPVAPINTPNSTYSITGLAKGNYTVSVVDANGTSTTPSMVTISEPSPLVLGLSNTTARLCFGENTGSVDVAVNGGVAPYTISWTGAKGGNGNVPGTSGTVSNLVGDKYTFTVVDANGCNANAIHTIAENPEIIADIKALDPTCGSPTTGSITVTATGGTTPPAFTYAKDGTKFESNGGAFTKLGAGFYKVVVKDGVGCQSVPKQIELKSPSGITIVDPIQKTDAHCGVNGTITVTATGGSGDLTFNLRRVGKNDIVASNKTGKFVDVPAGKYFVEVTDGGTCPATSVNLTIAPGGTSSITEIKRDIDNILCNGGTGRFTVWAKGIVGTVHYDVINLATGTPLQKDVDYTVTCVAGAAAGEYTIMLMNIRAGKYQLQVWDDNSCPQSFKFLFSDPALLTLVSNTKVDPKSATIKDGSITVVVAGGTAPYTYELYDENNLLVDHNQTGVFANLGPGKYVVKAKGQGDCEVVTPEMELVAQSNLVIDNIIVEDPKCHDESNGSIEIYASGGVGKLQYSIDNGVSFRPDNIFPNLPAGEYDVVVMDDLGVPVTQKVTLKNPESVVLTLVQKTLPSVGTSSDGSITVIATGGSGFYTVSIVDKANDKELMSTLSPSVEVGFRNLPSSTYKTIAVDEKGCTAIIDPIVLERLSVAVTATDVACSNATTGKLDVAIRGGVEPYKLTWQKDGDAVNGPFDVTGNAYSIDAVSAGKYTVTVTDAANSTVTIKKEIRSLNSPIVAVVKKVSDPICPDGLNGFIELGVSGGKPAYVITWTPETPNPNGPTGVLAGAKITGLHPSKYSVNIADANGCSVVVDATIASTPAINIESTTTVAAKCNGDANGSITIKASGGVGDLKYSTSVDGVVVENTTGQFDNLKAGKYVVTVTDTKNCTAKSAEVEVSQPDALNLQIKEAVDQGCSTPGKIVVGVDNRTGKISYVIDAGSTNETGIFENLSEGSHTIVATDELGCSASVTRDIVSTASIKITKVKVTPAKCNGAANGSLEFDVEERTAGGLDGLTVTVNGTAVTRDAATNLFMVNTLPAGAATIIANNSSNCQLTQVVNIDQPVALAATAKVTKVPTADTDKTGEVVATVTGGTGPYSLVCTNTTTNEQQTLNGDNVTFQGLARGKYTILVTDANGCTVSVDAVTIGLPTIVAKGISGNCRDPKGSIEVTITDGAKPYVTTYTKKGETTILETRTGDDNVVTFAGVDVGDYTVSLVDASGNTATVDVSVPVYVKPTVAVKAKCFINNNHYLEIVVPENLKNYKVTDANGVEYAEYKFDTHRIEKLQPDQTYTVQIIDELGCPSDLATIDMKDIPELKIEDPAVTNVLCFGSTTGKVEFKATGGNGAISYTLSLDGGTYLTTQDAPVFDKLAAGKYKTKILENASGCYSLGSLEVTQPTELQLSIDAASSNTHLWCASKKIGVISYKVADAVPGYTVKLINGGDTQVGESQNFDVNGAGAFENLAVGRYKLVAVDKNGCDKTLYPEITGESIKVALSMTPSECRRFVNPEDAKTFGGTATLSRMYGNFDAPSTFFFKKGRNLLAEPVEPAAMPDQEGYYQFNDGESRTISQLQGIGYSLLLRVVAPQGVCDEEISFNTGVDPANDFNAIANPDKTVCINSTLEFMGDLRCNDDKSKYEQDEAGKIKLDENSNPINKRYFVEWLGDASSKLDIEYNGLLSLETAEKVKRSAKITQEMVAGKAPFSLRKPYIFKVTSRNGRCYDQDTAKVEVYPFSSPYFTGPIVRNVKKADGSGMYSLMRIPIGATQDVLLKYGFGGFTKKVVWEPKDSGWFGVNSNDENKVTVVGNLGEEAGLRARVSYNVNADEVCEETAELTVMPLSKVSPPNAFTPNGDGFNDTWRVIFDEEITEYPDLEVEIYNRWGSIVYHAKPYKNDWNGKHNGKDLPVGTYYYIIKLHKGMLPNITGSVSIIR